MPSMFSQNKWILKDAPFHHSLTPFLSMVSKIIYMELMVRLSFLLSSVLTNHNLGHRIAQVCVVFEILSRAVQEHQIFQSSMTLPTRDHHGSTRGQKMLTRTHTHRNPYP